MPEKRAGTVAAPSRRTRLSSAFAEVVGLIEQSRQRAWQAVSSELVGLYWQLGEYISRKIESAEWGEGVVEQLAQHIARRLPGQRGFSVQNLWRMRQFYDAYRGNTKLSPLVRVLPWTHNLIILGQARTVREREFYLRMALRERWGKRELERQFRLAAYEHTTLRPAKLSPRVREIYGESAVDAFRDTYSLEFLGLPTEHTEASLHQALVQRLQAFLIELGRDFCFVGSQYPLQVGRQDFALDLLFFHRGLNCLVAIELKVGRFEPAHLGQLNFYLEVLDQDVRKPHEKPSIGMLLCASKDDQVVRYALSRSLSPAMVAQYRTALPTQRLLTAKLHEMVEQAAPPLPPAAPSAACSAPRATLAPVRAGGSPRRPGKRRAR